MRRVNIKLEIAKQAEQIKLEDITGTLTIEAALKQAQRNFNRLHGLQQIINELRGDEDETEIHAIR